ncbi:MAG: LUD domain-containing protein, partial [Candidatus Bathyarchaeia archaeon]
MSLEALAKDIMKAQENTALQLGLKNSVANFYNTINRVLNRFPELAEIAEHVKAIREKVLENLEYYIDQAIKSINAAGAHAHFASDPESVHKIIDDIVGDEKRIIVKAKSMVTEEIMLREHLAEKGHEVYETDLGEFLIQISKGKPMHVIVPAIHLSKEQAAQLLGLKLGQPISREATHEELVFHVREFFREKFGKADIGISGA